MDGTNDNSIIHTELVDTPIDWDRMKARLDDPDVGAHGWFLGVTRRTTGDRITDVLSYEANRPMAVLELRRLAEDAVAQFGLRRIVIAHRLGVVPIGQASVIVGCSSGHRPATFQALPWVMDRLKTDVPIWKQEHFADGSRQWIHPTEDTAPE